jgi:hypothetical protein
MPIALADFPRPPHDNGRGLHGSATPDWSGGDEGYDHWIRELCEMGIKWFKVLDDAGNSLPFCEKLLAAGIFPIVRILRRDPPPNDTPEPNPGHLGSPEEKTIQRLVAAGVRYFETNNEPNLNVEWKHGAMPGNLIECAKLVALNWLFDARLILSLGGLPGLPAIGNAGAMDLMSALVTLGRQDILLEGCWIALHNYGGNRPLIYPDDPINRSGQTLTPAAYEHGAFTQWAWWNTAERRADTIETINAARANQTNPAGTLQQDHACWREFEHYNMLAMKYLGYAIPIISTAGGYQIGRRDDLRYPRVTPDAQRELTVATFDFMQRQAPDYYFAAVPWLAFDAGGFDADAWYGAFWNDALTHGSGGHNNLPTTTVPNHGLGERLPVIDAVKAMQNLARRLPGIQPAPPFQPSISIQPGKPTAPSATLERAPTEPAPVAPASWLRDVKPLEPKTAPALKPVESVAPVEAKPVEPEIAPAPQSVALVEPKPVEPEIAPALKPVESVAPVEAKPVEPEIAPALKPVESVAPVEAKPAEPEIAPAPQSVAPVEPKPVEPAREPISEPTPVTPQQEIAPPPFDLDAPEKLAPPETFEPAASPPVQKIAPEPQPITLPIGDELEWDWRLDALNVTLEPAQIEPGYSYWKLVRAVYQGPDESKDAHQILYTIVNERNEPIEYQKVWQNWADGETEAITNERGETNTPLWAAFAPDHAERGPYAAWVDGLPSDRVTGLGLPSKRHVSFLLTWRRTTAR